MKVTPLDEGQSCIQVRNVRDGVAYHLTFEGDVSKLTSGQLYSYVEGISGAPIPQIRLFHSIAADLGNADSSSSNLQLLEPSDNRSPIGLWHQATLLLHIVPDNNVHVPEVASSGKPLPASVPVPPPREPSVFPSAAAPIEHSFLSASPLHADVRRDWRAMPEAAFHSTGHGVASAGPLGGGGAANHHKECTYPLDPCWTNRSWPFAAPTSPTGLVGEITTAPGFPGFSAGDAAMTRELASLSGFLDAEEDRIHREDFTWRLEQVQLETERMQYELELQAKRRLLECQSDDLDRRRAELEAQILRCQHQSEQLKEAMLEDQRIEGRVKVVCHGLTTS